MASELIALHDDNLCKFHVSNASISDACVVEPRGRFVTERGKKKKKKDDLILVPRGRAPFGQHQESRFLVLTKRSEASGDENETI